MVITHNSREKEFRSPSGAVSVGCSVDIAIKVSDCDAESVRLMLWHGDDPAPEYIEMHEMTGGPGSGSDSAADHLYKISVDLPDEGCLMWYAFQIEAEFDGYRQIIYYGNNDGNLGGEGRIYETDPARYQITVYREANVPSWYKDGIVYQIFPDRFSRDDDWRERCEASVNRTNSRPGGEKRLIEEDWNRPAYYIRDENGRVTDWPLYGGSFRGIESRLDYLKSLGVTAIYLNPIFDAVSNHRYDTSDYMKPDPALGSEEDFARLANAAKECGIRLILDGVFSHTGADSVYFDRYGNYTGDIPGAYMDPESPYRSWYKFDESEPCGYKSWWGVDDLPEVNENDPGFRELITGEDGVIAHWTELGASGWRLDVADELPDSFIRDIRARIHQESEDGLIIGEVWEDASNKISYGERRRYFMGDELDGVMNYPLRDILLDYINYTIGAGYAGERLLSLKENYPRENFYGGLNLIGSHDRERIITLMAASEDYESAVRKVRMLSTLQYALPGVPCIYYGDEAGLTGGADPLNRNGYPWGYENLDLGYHYRMLGLIYDEHPVLRDGEFTMLSGRGGISDDIFAFLRYYESSTNDGERILVLANRSYGPVDVDLRNVSEAAGEYALELLTSTELAANENGLPDIIHMDRLSVMVICIRDKAPEKESIDRGAGVICHISSLGKGVLGSPAREFADFLASAGMSVWQVLPLNPAGTGGSPYSSFASFAGNPDFINRDELPDLDHYEEFLFLNMDWLTEYAVYTLITEMTGTGKWSDWPELYRNGDPEELMKLLSKDHGPRLRELFMDQYYFHEQWNDLREYANGLGIRLMGDLPMYMAGESADVWANREIFRLDESGRLRVHAGVPPDAFSGEGQDWGNPLYDWDELKRTGYDWWKRRLAQCAEKYDILRIDHFRGLSEYFAIPEGAKPSDGAWQHSGGIEFIEAIRTSLISNDPGFANDPDLANDHDLASEGNYNNTGNGELTTGEGRTNGRLELIAEDLGFLDAGVKNLLKLSGLPGMDIWQFTADEMLHMPEGRAKQRIFYTGTHDNDTIIGFIKEKVLSDDAVNTEAEIEALKIFRQIYESPASLAMIQLQDMFLLDSDARMNVPGVAEGNWTWKMPGDSVYDAFEDAEERAAWFRELAERTGRF